MTQHFKGLLFAIQKRKQVRKFKPESMGFGSMGFGGMGEVRIRKTNGATTGVAIAHARMTLSQDHVRRLNRLLEALVALVSLLEAQRGVRVEDGRVQVDATLFGQILKERFRERSFRHGRDGLAELFRCRDDRPFEIISTHWNRQNRHVFVLGEGPLQRALEEAAEAAKKT